MKKLLTLILLLIASTAWGFDVEQSGSGGDVVGPASSTDNALVRFDSITGKIIQNSGVTIDDTNNMSIPATYTSIHTFHADNWNEDAATWTMTTTGPLVHVTGNTTTVTATNTEAIVAGVTYKVTVTGTGGGGTATYTLGGVTGTTIAASGAIAITDYITASTTASMIITPASACTVSITSITIQKLTDSTGDLTVDGNLTVRSPMYAQGRIYNSNGTVAYPSYSFTNDTDTGIYTRIPNAITFAVGGSMVGEIQTAGAFYLPGDTAQIGMGALYDARLVYVAADHFALRRTTNPQTFSLYETYTDASNYEMYSLNAGVTTADTFTIMANTLGTGGDNLNIALTPAGTGRIYANAPIVLSNTTETCGSGEGTDLCTDVPGAYAVYVTSTAATTDVMAIADGVAGQEKLVVLKTDNGADIDVTPTNFANGTKITLDTAGESVLLHFDGVKWNVVATYGGVVS